METRAHYIAVGAFVLAILFAAFVAVIWLAQFQFATQYRYYVVNFHVVSGLSEGAQVQYNGVPVGRVVNLKISPQNVARVRVLLEINADVVIKTDSVASLQTSLLSGVSFIQISGGTQDAPILAAKKGEDYPVIISKRSSLERVSSRAPHLLEKLIEVADNLNAILDKQNRQALANSLANVELLSARLADSTKDIDTAVKTANTTVAELGTLVHDIDESYTGPQGLKDQVGTTLGDYDRLAKGLIETNRHLDATVQSVRPGVHQFAERTLSQVGDLITETRQLVAGLTRLAAQIERDPTRFLFGERREGYRPR